MGTWGRLLCRLGRHDWWAISNVRPFIYQQWCRRCPATRTKP